MDKHAKIKKVLESFGLKPNLPITATVVSVEGDSCTVKLASSLVLTDVRLKATISDTEDVFLTVPKVGTQVLVMSQTGDLNALILLKADVLESIRYRKNNLEFVIDGTTGKVTLKNATANFGALLENLIDTLSNAAIVTPAGPGSIDPATKTQLLQIKTAFKTFLNTN